MFRFEELDIWKLAMSYANDVYDLTEKMPSTEKYNAIGQLKSAALSISNNIAEGSGTATIKNFKSFLDISIASIMETVNILHFAKARKYITEMERTVLYQKAETLVNPEPRVYTRGFLWFGVKKIRAFKNSLK